MGRLGPHGLSSSPTHGLFNTSTFSEPQAVSKLALTNMPISISRFMRFSYLLPRRPRVQSSSDLAYSTAYGLTRVTALLLQELIHFTTRVKDDQGIG